MKTAALLLGVLAFSMAGCGDDEPAPPTIPPATPAAPAIVAPAVAEPKAEYEPEYTLDIKAGDADPKTYTVVWTATVNTGGWSMKTDQATAEESMRKRTARIFVTLEAPNPRDAVTQAMTTLTGEFDAGDKPIDAAELSVRRHVKGVTYDTPATYAIVKRAKLAQ